MALDRVLDTLNVLANLTIVSGYLAVPFTVLRALPFNRSVIVSGSVFFTTCAITHLSMAFGFEHSPAMVANHVIQAFAVQWFVASFWLLLRAAERVRAFLSESNDSLRRQVADLVAENDMLRRQIDHLPPR